MTEEEQVPTPETPEETFQEAQEAAEPAETAATAASRTLDTFLASACVEAVYGEPIRHGDTLIIPAAEVLSGVGFGIAEGSGESEGNRGGGGGGGGGGRVLARPVAVVVCTPNGVTVKPVMDPTKLGLAAITAFGFMLATLSRMRRLPRH